LGQRVCVMYTLHYGDKAGNIQNPCDDICKWTHKTNETQKSYATLNMHIH